MAFRHQIQLSIDPVRGETIILRNQDVCAPEVLNDETGGLRVLDLPIVVPRKIVGTEKPHADKPRLQKPLKENQLRHPDHLHVSANDLVLHRG